MRRSFSSVLAPLVLVAATLVVTGAEPGPAAGSTTVADQETSGRTYGDARAVPRKVSLTRTEDGYYYSAWGSHNRLTVTLVKAGLRFRDPRPTGWDRLAKVCKRKRVARGVAAVCPVPKGVSADAPLELFLEMRLGNDYVDTSALGPEFRAHVLGDKGRDVVKLGAGDDFFNGYLGRDRVWGGDGDDFLRPGEGRDLAYGEGGNDQLMGLDGPDELHGGEGDDLVNGGPGDDLLFGDAGADDIKCGDGTDTAEVDPADVRRVACENPAEPG